MIVIITSIFLFVPSTTFILLLDKDSRDGEEFSYTERVVIRAISLFANFLAISLLWNLFLNQ
jgi:hypothetical protein